ncbi:MULTISPECIES: HAD family hydrolase [unclassified Nocardioides]|uniref:HAD family hydrolase n=1 Tax=unclassified Nocardioides TaxID=2615069 RepID=UPI0030155C47
MAVSETNLVVTFDLFSALTDSRTGAAALLGRLAAERGWEQDGTALYDRWDRHNKALQRTARPPTTFHDLSREALARAYDELGHPLGRVDDDLALLEESVADWPLWPDAEAALQAVATLAEVGILSNVDDALVRRSRAYPLVDPERVLTSQRLGAYKPAPEIYRSAVTAVAPARLVHVAASARDVRGALEAGIATVRLARPGHLLDPDGPAPTVEVGHGGDLRRVVADLSEG